MKILFYFYLFFPLSLCATFPTFDQSMLGGAMKNSYRVNYTNNKGKLFLFEHIYNKNIYNLRKQSDIYLIPRILHWIWLGSPVPKEFLLLIESFKAQHPTWEFKVWNEDAIKALKLINRKLFDEAVNFAEKSDIARIEILYQYGGIYCDVDILCLRPLDQVVKNFIFFATLSPANSQRIGYVSNSIIGSVPGHPLLRRYIQALSSSRHKENVIERTGAGVFTKIITEFAMANSIDNIIFFPGSYFAPLGIGNKEKMFTPKKYLKMVKQESFTINFYAGTWWSLPGAFSKNRDI